MGNSQGNLSNEEKRSGSRQDIEIIAEKNDNLRDNRVKYLKNTRHSYPNNGLKLPHSFFNISAKNHLTLSIQKEKEKQISAPTSTDFSNSEPLNPIINVARYPLNPTETSSIAEASQLPSFEHELRDNHHQPQTDNNDLSFVPQLDSNMETHFEHPIALKLSTVMNPPPLPMKKGRSGDFRNGKNYSPYQSTSELIQKVETIINNAPVKLAIPFLPPAVAALRTESKTKSVGSDLGSSAKQSQYVAKSPNRISRISRMSKESILSNNKLHDRFGSSVYLSSHFASHSSLRLAIKQNSFEEFIKLKEIMKNHPDANGARMADPSRVFALKKFRMKKFNSSSTLFVDRTILDADILEILR